MGATAAKTVALSIGASAVLLHNLSDAPAVSEHTQSQSSDASAVLSHAQQIMDALAIIPSHTQVMDAPVSIPEHTRYNEGIRRSIAGQVAARDAVLILLRSLQFDPGKAWRAWNHFRALQFDFCCASMLASKLTNMGVLSNKICQSCY
jgi:hypothetical protein